MLADVVLERADEIADAIVAETAKPRLEAFATELFPALDTLTWLARNAPKLLAPERVSYPQLQFRHKRAQVLHEPLGVVGVITPWNFPFAIPFTQVAFAVAAGNAVVLKPSELTPLSGALVEELFAAAGAPPSLVRVAQGDGDVGAALVRAHGLGEGRSSPGRVRPAAWSRPPPANGSCLSRSSSAARTRWSCSTTPTLRRAVDGALWASFFNCGQVCSGVERIYVEGALYEPFVEELAARARDARARSADLPRAARACRRARRSTHSVWARERLPVARAPDRVGWFYEPTVLVDVPADARIERDETFGPVVTVARVPDEAAAVRAANAGTFGLGASVWTRSSERAARVETKLRAGSVWHNDHAYTYATAQATWGGRGASGFGRTHSKHGLYDLTAPKFVDRDSGRVPVPWWFPYDDEATLAFRGLAGVLYGSRKLETAWRERRALLAMAKRYLA